MSFTPPTGMRSDAAISRPEPGPFPAGARLERCAFADLDGWDEDDLRLAFATFLKSCRHLLANGHALRGGYPPPPALLPLCEEALLQVPANNSIDIRNFFESRFTPHRILPHSGDGFLTAYYEPEVPGSLTRQPDFPVPVLARPPELVTFAAGEPPPPYLDQHLAAAVAPAGEDGVMVPAPDRAAIEDGAYDGRGLELVWLRDRVELFMIHVQGSARVRLADGSLLRLTYAGRNGHPYTSIGKVIIAEGYIGADEMSLERLTGWLRRHPDAARLLMRLNRSYIFFARNETLASHLGPIGGANLPLTPHRSIAVDRGIWAYGLPFFLDTELPRVAAGPERLQRLMIAQDTGSAILGPARADYFMGTGSDAGARAGLVRQTMKMSVLWPNARAAAGP